MTRHSGRWVSYLRVSTDRQGASGLGLEAQRKAVADYLNGDSRKLAAEYVEIESGKRQQQPGPPQLKPQRAIKQQLRKGGPASPGAQQSSGAPL
jgi:hypothetical protein